MTTTIEDLEGGIFVAPWSVMHLSYRCFKNTGEWPKVRQLHEIVAEWAECPVEVARADVLNALESGYVYGLPTVVAMRLGEATGDWRGSLPEGDTGWRIAVDEKWWHGPIGSSCCEEIYLQHKLATEWFDYVRNAS